MAAFDDAISGSGEYADFDPAPALDSLIRRTTSGLPADGPLTADMLVNRLARKMGQTSPAELEPAEIQPPAKTDAKGNKALDFSSEGVPVDSLPDLSEFGTPAEQQPAAPVAAPPPAASSGVLDYGGEFGKGVARGFKGMASSSLKGIAAVVPEAGAQPEYDALGNPTGINNGAETGAKAKPMEERLFFRGGKAVDEFGKDALAPAKGWEGSWTGDIGAGFGSMLAGIPVALIPGVGPLVGASLYTTAGMGEAVENAVKNKATDSQAESAGMAGAIAGATDVVDIMLPFFGRSTGAALGFIKRVGLTAIKGAIAEGGQEGIQQLIQNAIAKGIYKPDQDMFEDVPRSMAIAAIVGGTVAGGGAVVSGRDRGAPAQADQNAGAGAAPNGPGPAPGGPGSGPQSSSEDINDFIRRARAANPNAEPEAEAAEPGYTGPDPATMSEADWINAYAESRASHDGASDAQILKAAGMSDEDIAKLDEEQRINAVIRAAKRPGASQGTGEQAQSNQKRSEDAAPSQDDLDYSIMRAGGWSHEDIENMGAKQRAREAKYFRDELGLDQAQATAKFKRPQPEAADGAQGPQAEAGQTTGTREEPIKAKTADDVAKALPAAPKSDAQAQAENYRHAHVDIEALGLTGKRNVSIETGAGQERKGVDPDGKPWSITMPVPYGRIKGTKGADGQALDIFIGPNPASEHVFIIDQHHAKGGGFDEHKIMSGFDTPQNALRAYAESYADKGGDRIGGVTAMTPAEFKAWLKTDTTKPVSKMPASSAHVSEEAGSPLTEAEPASSVPKVATQEEAGGHSPSTAANEQNALDGKIVPAPQKKKPGNAKGLPDEIVFKFSPAKLRKLFNEDGTRDRDVVLQISRSEEDAFRNSGLTSADGLLTKEGADALIAEQVRRTPAPKKKAAPRSDEPTNLLQFIAANGGVKPDGDLRAMDAHKHRVQIPGKQGFFGLVKADGHSPDVMRRMAQEAGFFRADKPDAVSTSSVRDFYSAIEDGLRGQHTLSEEELDKETKQQHQTRAESSGAARDKARAEAAEAIAAEYPGADPELVTLAAKIMVDEGQTDIDTAVERAAVRMVDGDPDYGVTPEEISAIYGQGAIDEVRPQPASEDGEQAASERVERDRSTDENKTRDDGEDVPRSGAEVVPEEDRAEVAASDSDETVEIALTAKGPWDFNDTWPKPDTKLLEALEREGRNPFDSTAPGAEEVASILDEGMNALMSDMAEIRAIDQHIDDVRSGKTKLKKKQTIEDALKPLKADRAQFAQALRDGAASHQDLFGKEAADAMMKEARRRIVQEETSSPGERVRPAEPATEAPATDDAAWWDALDESSRNDVRFRADLPTKFKTEQPWAKIPIPARAKLSAERPKQEARKAKWDAERAAEKIEWEKDKAAAEALVKRRADESDAEYFGRVIDGYYEFDDNRPAHQIVRDALGGYVDVEHLTVPMPKGQLRNVEIEIGKTPIGYNTGTSHDFSGFSGAGASAGIWPDRINDELAYHETRDDALRYAGEELIRRFTFDENRGDVPATIKKAAKAGIGAVEDFIHDNTTPPTTDKTEAGEQTVLPGAEKIGDGELVQRKADTGLKPKVAQKPADIGLFGDSANQTDLLDRVERVLGADADKVAPVDIARAAELLADNEGMEPATAFQHAVIENAVAQGFITEQEAIDAYGTEVEDILESVREGTSGRSSDVEQEGAAPVEVGTRDAAQAGKLSGGREGVSEGGADQEAGRTDTDTTGRSEAARDEARNTAENIAATDAGVEPGAWWNNLLTPEGRRYVMKKAGISLPTKVYWHNISPEDQAKLLAVRTAVREAALGAEPLKKGERRDLGLNPEGYMLQEDHNGVRSYFHEKEGLRETESRTMGPEGEWLPNDPSKRKPRWKTVEENANGISASLRDGDARAGAEDVQPAGTVGRVGSAPDGEVPGGGADVRGSDQGRAEGAGRVSEGAGGDRGGRASAGGADRISGERADQQADRRTKRDAQQAADRVEGENYAIEPGSLGEDRSFRVKAADNIRALELANEIVAAGRPATHEEQRLLALYVGWGGIKGAFPDGDGNFATGYASVGARLKELLSPDEYETARRSIQYAHYTAEDVVRSMWSAVQRLGFKQGQVFEPGMGVGNFAGMMPGDVAADSHYQGLELDHTTARIAKLLYPKYGVRQQDFTKAPLPENAYDLVIGNPPFADVSIKSDPKYKQGFLLHDYFFAKSIDAVRPGGLLAFVTSAGTMNKIDTDARDYIADRADLVGAIRLPGDAFKENAGTEVTTDIIFLRKRLPGEAQGDRTWTETVEATMPNRTGQDIRGNVNRYFAEHPDMVLGEQGFFDKLYENRYSVRARKGVDLKEALAEAIAKLPSNVMSDWQNDNANNTEHDFETVEKKEGTFYLGPDGALHQMQSGVGKPVERRGKGIEGGKSEADIARIKGLIPIRDSLRAVYAADLSGDTKAADKARAALNKSYDAFVEKFGPINKSVIQTRRPTVIQQESARSEAREEARYASLPFKEGSFDPREMIENGASLAAVAKARKDFREAMQAANQPFDEGQFDIDEIPDTIIDKRPNVDPFMDDPESYRLRAIERYDDASGKAFKSPVFSENIITRERVPEINSINDALLYSLSQYGRVNIPAMAELAKKSEKEVLDELGEAVFLLPGTRDTFQTRDEYLSGDVRKKLAIAQAAAEKNPELRRNVAALEAAQPAPLAPSQIFAQLGMPWLPPHIIKQFGTEELGLETLKVQYVPAIAQWIVSGDTDSVAASTTWGTADRRAPALLSDALNRVTTKIYDTVYVDNQKKSVLNTDKTQAAQDKVLAIREKFADWIWRDQQRADDLAGLYNEKYNNLVVREYDGSYLTTPGIASNWKWRPHQKRVIARIIQSGNTYAAHAVGAGKTSEFIGAVMEMRRLGLVRKPMITVPNHMLAQFTKEFYEQYPTARLAIADERRFHTDRRKQFIANVATDDLDAIIITHSAFGMIPVSEDFANNIVRAEIAQYRELLSTIDKGQESRITRSRIENQIEKLEQRLVGRGNKRRDQVFTFEEMGVDHLTVDEAHLFRKLDFSTQMSNLKGVSPEGSQMAWDLYVKSQYLNTIRPGRGLVLGSGTPVTNTMAELYTVSRYLQPDVLAERGLEKFDAWAGAFGDQVSELEQDAAGNYKPVSRFAKFINVAELSAMVRQVMDVVTSKQLEQYVVRPKLIGGKRAMHLAEKGPALEAFQQGLAARMKAIEARKGPPKKGDDIMLSVINDGRHAAIDLRLVGLQNDPNYPSKLDLMIDNMFAIWKASKNQKFYKPGTNGAYETKPTTSGPATQMAFVNLGLSGKRGFSVPDYIRAELVRRGVPKDEIAYIYDYPTSVAKQRLFNDMNEGKKRFLIGSTAKMATGVNAQRRLLAVHNMDPLWYPADDEQRNGRALRQGNMNPEIGINDYSTKGTYDSTMWGMMAKKARFIQGFFEGDPSLRSMDDLGEASQYEQAKALTTNDPRLIKLTELKQDLERADRRKAAFDNEAYALRQRRANEKASAEHYGKRIEETKADLAQRVPTAGDAFKGKVGKASFDKRVEFGEALYEAIGKLEEKGGTLNGATKVAEVGGFPIYVTVQQSNLKKGVHVDVFMSLNGDREREVRYELSSIGTVRSIEHILNNLDSDLAEYQQRKDKAEKFLAESASQTNKKFEGDAEIARLVQEVRELEAELKSTPAPDAPGTTENQAGAEIDPAAMADAVSDALQPMSPEKQSEVMHLVTSILQHLVGNHVKVEFSEGVMPVVGAQHYGKAAKHAIGSRGMYSPMFHMIRLALIDGIDKSSFHEAYHAIEFQLQTPRERELMERETARLRDYVAKVKKGYTAEEVASLSGEEVRAIAFEHYADARAKNQPDPGRGLHIGMRHWFNRLWENLQKLANGLRGLGFQTYEDIFKKAYRGDYAKASGATPREEADFAQDDGAMSSIFEGANDRVAAVAKRAGYDGTELRTQIQDKFIRVKKAEESVGGVPSAQSAYQAESLYYGRTGEQLEQLENEHLDPMIDDMKSRDISLERMNDYLYAKHAPERNAAMDAINHPELMAGGRDLRGKGSGMSDAEAAAIIERIRAEGKLADYEAIERRVQQIQSNTRDLLVASGLISQETADAWESAYDHYVPLRGFEEGTEDEAASGRGQGFDTRAGETKKAYGRLSKAAGPLSYVMLQAEMAIIRAEKNRVGNAWLRFVRAHPDAARWTVDTAPKVKTIDHRTGLVTEISDPHWQGRDDVFVTKVGGRAVMIQLHGADGKKLARALKNIGTSNLNTVLKYFHALTTLQSRLATQWNPNFTVPNLARDLGEAFINLQAQDQERFIRIFAGHLPGALKGSFDAIRGAQGDRYADAFREFDKAGGRIRFFGLDNPDDIGKSIAARLRRLEGGAINNIRDAGQMAVEGLEIINGSIENATRLAAYMAAREVGMSIPDSASLARELTVNFNRKGELGAAINALYMFGGASIQGTARMGRAMQHKRVRRAAYALVAIGALAAMLAAGAGGEDDQGENYYAKIKPWIRDKNIIIMWPKGYGHDGQYIKIPLPYGFSPFFVLGARTAMAVTGKDKPGTAAGAVLTSIFDAFNPLGEESASSFSLIPSIFRPVAHIQANKNWNGNPLYPSDERSAKGIPDSEKSFKSNSAFSKSLASGLNSLTGGSPYKSGWADFHPGSIDHVFETLTGGLGKFIKDVVMTGGAIYKGEPFDATKAPIIRRFVGTSGDAASDSSSYYSMRDEARANGSAAVKAAQKDRRAGNDKAGAAEDFLRNNQNSIRGEEIFKAADNQMKALRERENRVTNDKSMLPDEREASLKEVRSKMREVQNTARKRYMDMKREQAR